MSQDWTPKEQLLAESLLEGRTWRDVAKGLSFVKQDGTTVPMYEESTLNFINQFSTYIHTSMNCPIERQLKSLLSAYKLSNIFTHMANLP